MFFSEISGHNKQKALIRQLVNRGNMPHAQIFFGPAGVGKLGFVRAAISYLLCLNRTENDSCGECSACIKSHKLIHPDVHFTFPTIGTKVTSNQLMKSWRAQQLENPFTLYSDWLASIGGENKQGNINKDECNQMVKSLGLKSFESDQKVWLIWGGEYLGKEGNRLLKIIEEPPEQTYIFIVVDQLDMVLGTIRSRCQSLKLGLLAENEVVETLRKRMDTSEDVLKNAANISEGNIHAAFKILDEDVSPFVGLWSQYVVASLKNDSYEVSKCVDDIAKLNKEQQKFFAKYASFFLREIFVQKTMPTRDSKLSANESQLAKKLAERWSFEALEEITELMSDLEMGIQRNGNIKILLFDTYLLILESAMQPVQ